MSGKKYLLFKFLALLFVAQNSVESICEDSAYFQCNDGKCIHPLWRCDDEFDCDGKEDELNCSCEGKYLCWGGDYCFSLSLLCDGKADCPQKDDEIGCPDEATSCVVANFQCLNGRCILGTWHCDGDNDCGDWSDELNCTCRPNQKACPGTGVCISDSCICDGYPDCPGPDPWDESIEAGCRSKEHDNKKMRSPIKSRNNKSDKRASKQKTMRKN